MLLSFSLATLSFSAQHPSFDAFLAKYHKQYAGAEYSERRAAYEAAVATIEAHNAGSPSWTMKLSGKPRHSPATSRRPARPR